MSEPYSVERYAEILLKDLAKIDWKVESFIPANPDDPDVYQEALGLDLDDLQAPSPRGVRCPAGKRMDKVIPVVAERVNKLIRGLITDYLENPVEPKDRPPAPAPKPNAEKKAAKTAKAKAA